MHVLLTVGRHPDQSIELVNMYKTAHEAVTERWRKYHELSRPLPGSQIWLFWPKPGQGAHYDTRVVGLRPTQLYSTDTAVEKIQNQLGCARDDSIERFYMLYWDITF